MAQGARDAGLLDMLTEAVRRGGAHRSWMSVRDYIDKATAREFFDQLKSWHWPSRLSPPIQVITAMRTGFRAAVRRAPHRHRVSHRRRFVGHRADDFTRPARRLGKSPGLPPGPGRADRSRSTWSPRRPAWLEPLGEWHSPPFEPAERDGQILGRGASDDKGQVLLHTLGLRACLAAGSQDQRGHSARCGHGKPGAATCPARASGLRRAARLAEVPYRGGERNPGSPHFGRFAAQPAADQALAATWIVISDTTMMGGRRAVLHVRTEDARWPHRRPDRPARRGDRRAPRARSGAACRTRCTPWPRCWPTLHDHEGRVTLPGFCDAVLPLTDAERELFARLPFDEKAFGWPTPAWQSGCRGRSGPGARSNGSGPRPTAEINGTWGGHTGPGQDHRAQPGARQGVVPAGGEPGAGRYRGWRRGSTWLRTPLGRASRRP